MTQKIENLTEEDVAIVQNVYNKQTKGTLFLGSLFFILGLLAIFLSKFKIEYFSMCLAGVFAFCFSYYSSNQAKKISINDIKEIMTGLFLQDYSEKGKSRTLTLKIDDQEKYYRYSWGLNAQGKKCGTFSNFMKGEDIGIEYFKMWGGKIMLRTYDVNQKGEKVMTEKPDQALLKQAIAKDEQTRAMLLRFMGMAVPFMLGLGYFAYSKGMLAAADQKLLFLAAGLYICMALFGMVMINFIFKKQIDEKRKLLDDYNPLDNTTR